MKVHPDEGRGLVTIVGNGKPVVSVIREIPFYTSKLGGVAGVVLSSELGQMYEAQLKWAVRAAGSKPQADRYTTLKQRNSA